MTQQPIESSSPIKIFYEVLPEDPQDADPAELQAVANSVVAGLRKEGYQVNAVPTGALGADLLYQIVQTAITHKDEIAGAVGSVKPIIEQIVAWYRQRQTNKLAQSAQGAVEVEARFGQDYDSFTFKSTGREGTEEFTSAFEQFLAHSQHARSQSQLPPASQNTVEGTITVRERVPARQHRKRQQ